MTIFMVKFGCFLKKYFYVGYGYYLPKNISGENLNDEKLREPVKVTGNQGIGGFFHMN
jgi:hypothetical protein